MVPISRDWTPFIDFNDQLEHFQKWGLIPEKSKKLRPIMVVDGYFGIPQPCKVVGYESENWAVIELSDGYHAIHGEYLAEMQPTAFQRLPHNVCFAEILSRYVVVDIETTGFDFTNDRIVEIAAVIYEFGEKKESFHTLINPEMILPDNIISLTGITQTDVDTAPILEDVSDSFFQFIQNLPIIGHNALTFDVPFLSARIKPIDNPVIDTLIMARKAFPDLPSHKLDYLKTALELGESASHRALSDVETTNELLWACLAPRRYESKVMHAYLDNVLQGTAPSVTKPQKKRMPSASIKQRLKQVDIKSIVPTVKPDPNSPLYGKCILFTGDLSIPRGQAMQIAVNAGAILKSSVSRKLNYLVVGKQDPALVGKSGRSTKEIEVEELNQSGKAFIKVISENEFLSLTKKVEVTV